MSTDYQQLICPESLPESRLLEILKNRCIELPSAKNLKKSDLIELYRRIALPMPQRQYNETKLLGKKLHDLRMSRKIAVATEEEQALYKSVISSQNQSVLKSDCKKTILSSQDPSPKKVCLTSSFDARNGSPENGLKRKYNEKEVPAQTESKKRQKIMWP